MSRVAHGLEQHFFRSISACQEIYKRKYRAKMEHETNFDMNKMDKKAPGLR